MNWIDLNDEAQIKAIQALSNERAQVIFKHSTRCANSSMAKNRLERSEQPTGADFYFLDLIRYRSLSDNIARYFSVHHESPQVLVLKNGECIYDESHGSINMEDIVEQLQLR